MEHHETLTIFIEQRGDAYVAQCIQYDICAQAPDMDTLFTRMTGLMKIECEEGLRRTGKPFGDLPPAPQYFADAAARVATPLTSPEGFEYRIAA